MEALTTRVLQEPEESEAYTLDIPSDEFAMIHDSSGNGFNMYFNDGAVKVEPWGDSEFTMYPQEEGFNYGENTPAQYEGRMEDFFDMENLYNSTPQERIEDTLQDAYDQAMEFADNKEFEEAAEEIEDTARWAKNELEEQGKRFTNVRLNGSPEKGINDVRLDYTAKEGSLAPNQAGAYRMEIQTAEDDSGAYATPLVYSMGMTLLEGSKQKPEVHTGFGHKDKDHHRNGKLSSEQLTQACSEARN